MRQANTMISSVCLLAHVMCCMVTLGAEPSPILCIDFGTSHSRIGVYRSEDLFEIIPNSQGKNTFSSCVAFTKDHGMVAGVDKEDVSSDSIVCDMKRLIGRTWEDPILQDVIKHYPFQIVQENNRPVLKIYSDGIHRDAGIDEITTFYLKHLREIAGRYLGQNVTRTILTIPDYFTDLQRHALRHAAQLAGLDVLILLSEPLAAFMAYPYIEMKSFSEDRILVVFHQGASSMDVCLIFHDYSGVFSIESSHTDHYLGGEALDKRVMELMLKVFQETNGGKDIILDGNTRRKLQLQVEKAKIQLSSSDHVILDIPDFNDGHSFYYNLSRAEFEEMNMDLFQNMTSVISDVLQNAEVTPDEIDDIIMAGGSTNVPMIQEMVKTFFSGQKDLFLTIDPELAVVYGCGHRAADFDKYADIEPFLDVTRLALGIRTHGGLLRTIIPTFTIIPTPKKYQTFSTSTDNQEAVNIEIYEGARPLCDHNKLLGQLVVPIKERSARGVPKIMVTFEVDVNYILTVSGQDISSGHYVSTVVGKIAENSETTKERIRESEMMAEEDKRTKELVESRLCDEQRTYTLTSRLDKLEQVNEETDQDLEEDECEGAFSLLEGPSDPRDIKEPELLDQRQQKQILRDKLEL